MSLCAGEACAPQAAVGLPVHVCPWQWASACTTQLVRWPGVVLLRSCAALDRGPLPERAGGATARSRAPWQLVFHLLGSSAPWRSKPCPAGTSED